MKLELKNDCMSLSLIVNDACTDPAPSSKLDPGNPNNPYDEVGTIHNEAIMHLESKFAGSDIVIQDDLMMTGWIFEDNVMMRASLEFLHSYPFKNLDIKEVLKEKSELIIDEIGQWDPRPGEIPFNSTFPKKTQAAAGEWLDRLRKADIPADVLGYGLSALGQGLIDSQEFIEQVKRFEAAAMSAKISKDDRDGVLVVGSIVRHSTALWANDPAAAKSASGPISADAKGAVSGMVSGLASGIGALAGAVVGAIVRSATYAATSKAIKS